MLVKYFKWAICFAIVMHSNMWFRNTVPIHALQRALRYRYRNAVTGWFPSQRVSNAEGVSIHGVIMESSVGICKGVICVENMQTFLQHFMLSKPCIWHVFCFINTNCVAYWFTFDRKNTKPSPKLLFKRYQLFASHQSKKVNLFYRSHNKNLLLPSKFHT